VRSAHCSDAGSSAAPQPLTVSLRLHESSAAPSAHTESNLRIAEQVHLGPLIRFVPPARWSIADQTENVLGDLPGIRRAIDGGTPSEKAEPVSATKTAAVLRWIDARSRLPQPSRCLRKDRVS
jgi:hypothetical protein